MVLIIALIILVSLTLIIKSIGQISKNNSFKKEHPDFKWMPVKGGHLGIKDEKIILSMYSRTITFDIDDINDCLVYSNDLIVSKGTRAVTGGLIFGPVGAIAGAVSGQGKLKEMGIRFYLNEGCESINFLPMPCVKGSSYASLAEKNIHDVLSLIKRSQ